MLTDENRPRDEYLETCKRRARAYLDQGNAAEAIASMGSDLMKHESFHGIASKLMPLGLFYAMHGDLDGARRFIEGFN